MSNAQAVIDVLEDCISESRLARMRDIVRSRMKGLTVVLEDLYDSGNRSAVYRTAEGHGIRDVHVIRPERARKPHARDVSRGSEKWLEIKEYESTTECMQQLRDGGFQVIAADLDSARPISTYTFQRPTALVFGNERDGITDEMRSLADGSFLIPMRGFIQSYNISVAAAIAVAHAREGRERALGCRTDLGFVESQELLASYMRRSFRTADTFLDRAGIDWTDPYS